MATFKFELVSPERLILSTDADQVDLPGSEGDFGVLAGHAPFLTTLKTVIVTVKIGGVSSRIYVRGGFADVNAAGLSVLAEKAVPEGEFDSAVASAELAAAEAEPAWEAVRSATRCSRVSLTSRSSRCARTCAVTSE